MPWWPYGPEGPPPGPRDNGYYYAAAYDHQFGQSSSGGNGGSGTGGGFLGFVLLLLVILWLIGGLSGGDVRGGISSESHPELPPASALLPNGRYQLDGRPTDLGWKWASVLVNDQEIRITEHFDPTDGAYKTAFFGGCGSNSIIAPQLVFHSGHTVAATDWYCLRHHGDYDNYNGRPTSWSDPWTFDTLVVFPRDREMSSTFTILAEHPAQACDCEGVVLKVDNTR
jgi:hypothetical protein